jgi:hypothetical protein
MRLLLLLLLFPILTFAQSEFLRNGESGLESDLSYVLGDNLNGVGYGFGFSALGKFDIGFEGVNATSSNSDISGTSYAMFAAYNFKSDKRPVTSKIRLGYELNNNNSPSSVFAGIGLTSRIQLGQSAEIYPAFNVDLHLVTVESAINFNQFYTESSTSNLNLFFTAGVGIVLKVNISQYICWFIGPEIAIGLNTGQISGSVGSGLMIIIPSNN